MKKGLILTVIFLLFSVISQTAAFYYVIDDYYQKGNSNMGLGIVESTDEDWITSTGTSYNDIGGKVQERPIFLDNGYVEFEITDSDWFKPVLNGNWRIKAVFHFTGKNWGWADTGFAVGIKLYDKNWNLLQYSMPGSGLSGYYITDGSFDTDYSVSITCYLIAGAEYRLRAYVYLRCWGSIWDGYVDTYSLDGYGNPFVHFYYDKI